MNAQPDIAVVMPSYNPGPEIAWTLDSLRAQTVPFKLFVTDDGSQAKPDYHDLLKGFDYELIELPENVGPCIVRNPSVRRAMDQGFEYIAQIDCGDWAYPTRLEAQLQFMKSRPDISLLGTAVEILNEDMSPAFDHCPPCEPAAIRKSLFYGVASKHPSMMYRTELLRRIGLYSNEFDAAEDYDMARRAAQVADLANLPDVHLKKVESVNSVSATRRTAQLVSRLRIQWRYRDLTSVHCWLGFIKTLIVLVVPTRWVKRAQPYLYRTRGPKAGATDGGEFSAGVGSEPRALNANDKTASVSERSVDLFEQAPPPDRRLSGAAGE